MLLFRCLTWRSGDGQNMDQVEFRGYARLCEVSLLSFE